ncbi:E3 ubiquitin-protein ligase listerin isoform X4 [Papio anubis]|uniref:E3 ubiquitin-protein ligase listerin isoform X4 n=1 Tax=Papio anubis TaxID=9555 RepID=UPI0012AE0171|nr:E3 ubiquitin-protein ligase listerin isoform X4 [Papio anubis]
MGGKNKQRTKGNLRPSNSGRAAELLAKEQGTVPGFIGFGTSQSDLGYVPAIQGAEEIDSLVDSDFRMVLRKLSKKDVTTKLKAMQEFGTMCTERDTETVKGVLPYWPRIFCKISLDHDRRVREATQQAFEKLILKVKKQLAPYLKSLMGYWLMAQCDTYTPAAFAAKDAFEAAFPPSKQPEAIAFCKDEITSVLQDHLIKETPDTLSDPQTVPEEEREAKFYRVVTCSLLALKKLLCLLPDNELDSLEEKFKSLLSQNKFWKYGKHSVPQIRSAYFELVSALCQRIPQLMKEEASKVSPSVLLSIDDSDPIVCPALWEAVLYTLTTIEDCWLHVNAKKSVFPKLSTVIREGGRGLATVIYPYLLPFISKLPQSITNPKLDFFKNFLTSLVAGLSTERTKTSSSESLAVISAFFECLRFIMQQNLGEEEIEQMLINDQVDLKWNSLLKIIEKACSSSDKHALVTPWLKGDILGEKLVNLADCLCNEDLESRVSSEPYFSERWTLLSLVLSQHVKNDYLIGDVYVERIIVKLHETLFKTKESSEAENSDSSVSFICDVAYNYFSSAKGCLLMPSSEDLLLTLFQLCAQSKEKTHLPDFLICKLKNTWLSGVNLLVHQTDSSYKESTFLHLSAVWLKNQVQASSLDINSLQVLLSAVDDLLNTLLESEDSYLMRVYIGSVMPNDSEWEKMRQSLPMQWLHRPLLEGRLSLNYECFKTDFKEQDIKTLPSHLCTSALLSKMVLIALRKEIVLENNELEKIIAELLYSLQWCEELDNPPIFLTGFCEMLQKMNITYDHLRVLGNTSGLLQQLFNRSREHGTLWSLIIAKLILSRSISSDEVKPHYKRKESFFPLTEGNLHTIQSLCPFLSKEEKKEFSAQCIPALLGWTKKDLWSTNGGFGHLAIFNSCLQTKSIDDGELLHGILKIIISWKKEHEDIFLFSCNLSEASPEVLGVNIEIIRFLSLFLKYCSSPLAESEWDFIMCSMLAWLETTSENQALYSIPLVQLFACVSCDLACDLSAFFDSTTLDTVGNLPVNLISEWKEFFSQGIHSLLLPILVTVTGENKDVSETSFQNAMLKPMCETLTYISKEQLLSHKLPARLVADQKTNLPEYLQTLLNTLAPLLLFRARPVQIAVYHMLYKLMPELPQYDQDNLKTYGDEEEEPALSPPATLMSLLSTQEDLLENVLGCVPVGQIVTIKPLSEDFCYVLGYLLTWKLILTFFKAASSQLRALYSMYLRKTKSLNKLLYHLFRLMPENPTYAETASEVPNKDPKTFFTEELQLSIRETATLPYHIPHLACSVYHMTLKDLPAMVRLWWNSSEKRVFNIVDRFTSKYVSSVLSFQEISSVQTSTQLFNGMTVKARATTREVMATYTIEDIVIELIIQLPSNYPLGSITVESGKRVGVAVQQWRNWMLQLSTYLTHQNGSIMEGLALWKNNVDKRFEGVEDCMICFSVIHGFNYSLPKKACRTCKKKFHSACLYKWFTSSNKSTCPLCRETFF